MCEVNTFKDYLYQTVQKTFNTVIMQEQDKSRILDVHPSSLPFCAYSFLQHWLLFGNVRPVRIKDELVLGTGTHFHEVLEKYMNESGADMYGDWFCTSCGAKITSGFRPNNDVCPHCNSQYSLVYRELGINYKGIVGHIDTILRDRNGDVWIVDYKTTTQDKLSSKAKDPGITYKTQIMTYALMVRLQYGLKVKGVCLLFIAKDKPSVENTSMWASLVTKEDLLATRNLIKETVTLKKAVIKAKTWDDISKIPISKCSNIWCPVCHGHSEEEIRDSIKSLCEKNPTALPIVVNNE